MSRSEKVALVTGSTSGIGAAIARRLSADGYIVALHSRSSADTGKAMAKELKRASYHQADLGNDAEPAALVADVLKAHGRLDVLVNNAGLSIRIPHTDLKAATPAFRAAGGGSVVLVSSINGDRGKFGQAIGCC